MPSQTVTRSVALPSPQEAADKKASRRTSSRNPYKTRPGRGTVPGRRARPWRGDRGAGSAELVIAVPLLMLLILLIVQFAVWEHASQIAQAAASEALAAARVQGGSAAAGQQRAAQVISQIGGSVLVAPRVSVSRTGTTVTVRVTATAETVIPVPGLSFPVTVTVSGPVERFAADVPQFANSEAVPPGN